MNLRGTRTHCNYFGLQGFWMGSKFGRGFLVPRYRNETRQKPMLDIWQLLPFNENLISCHRSHPFLHDRRCYWLRKSNFFRESSSFLGLCSRQSDRTTSRRDPLLRTRCLPIGARQRFPGSRAARMVSRGRHLQAEQGWTRFLLLDTFSDGINILISSRFRHTLRPSFIRAAGSLGPISTPRSLR